MYQRHANRAVELLLVEDNPADARLVEEALREARKQYHFHLARDGQEALDFLRREGRFTTSPRPDLILLDLNLPKVLGTEVLCAVRQDQKLRRIPVLMYTSSSSDRDVNAAYECGANGYVRKPAALDDMFDIVNTLEHFWLDLSMLPSATG